MEWNRKQDPQNGKKPALSGRLFKPSPGDINHRFL
jgi:hypothetical protein